MSLESFQRVSQEGGPVALKSLTHNLMIMVKESKDYSVAVDGLPRQDLWCLDVEVPIFLTDTENL